MSFYEQLVDVFGLTLNFGGALLLMVYSQKTIGATTDADLKFLGKKLWFRIGLGSVVVGFFLQLIKNVYLLASN